MFHISALLYQDFHKEMSQAPNQHIRVISEGCDTKYWSNDAENAIIIFINLISKYIQIINYFYLY